MTETTLMDRRAVFMRISTESDLIGKASVKPDKNTIIRYNWREADSMLDEIVKHAEQNDGKVIIPFDSIVSVRSLDICSRFILWRTDGKYLVGKLFDAGENYKHGMDDRDGYTTPKALRAKESSRWVKLSEVQNGEDFPFEDWYIEAYRHRSHSKTPLGEALQHSHMNVMFAYEED
jgi:hypothetical protein